MPCLPSMTGNGNHTIPPIKMVILGMLYGIVFPTLFGLGISILVTLPSLVLQIFGKDLRQFRDLLASFFWWSKSRFFTDDHPKHETRHFQLQRIHARVTMYD